MHLNINGVWLFASAIVLTPRPANHLLSTVTIQITQLLHVWPGILEFATNSHSGILKLHLHVFLTNLILNA